LILLVNSYSFKCCGPGVLKDCQMLILLVNSYSFKCCGPGVKERFSAIKDQ